MLPGLVDFHAHVLPGAGSFSAFKHFGIASSRTRIFAFLHISSIGLSGFPVGEMLNIDQAR